jgi:hypothetical protein
MKGDKKILGQKGKVQSSHHQGSTTNLMDFLGGFYTAYLLTGRVKRSTRQKIKINILLKIGNELNRNGRMEKSEKNQSEKMDHHRKKFEQLCLENVGGGFIL